MLGDATRELHASSRPSAQSSPTHATAARISQHTPPPTSRDGFLHGVVEASASDHAVKAAADTLSAATGDPTRTSRVDLYLVFTGPAGP